MLSRASITHVMQFVVLAPVASARVNANEPDIVTFCQLACFFQGDGFLMPHGMCALTGLKRLNFRVHPPCAHHSVGGLTTVIFVCEHMENGVSRETLESMFHGLAHANLILKNACTLSCPHVNFGMVWAYG